MVCLDCRWDPNKPEVKPKHANCKRRNKNKQGRDCDCQHRTK